MASTDLHLRNVLRSAVQHKSRAHVDDAFALIEDNADRFGIEVAPELLVIFAEVASDVGDREPFVLRALELYERLKCEDDQFKVRWLLVRCIYEARQGTDKYQLKGLHALQQLQYALSFLTDQTKGALAIATRPPFDQKYGFLVYNASLVFWDVVRPMCRVGWQRHLVNEMTQVLEALKVVAKAGGGGPADPKAKAGGGATAALPVSIDPAWLVELTLATAFALEDVGGRDADAIKRADEANLLVEDLLKQTPEPDASMLRMRSVVMSSRAYLSRKQGPGKVREEIDKASGSTVMGTVLFVRNGGIAKEASEAELIKAWSSIDTDFNMQEAKDKYDWKARPADRGRTNRKPQEFIELTSVVRAACSAGQWAVAQPMLSRLESFQIPAGRGRIVMDLCKAEISVYQACNIKEVDPVSKMLLTAEQQHIREIEARIQAVKLCEQCIMAARRIDDAEFVEDAAVIMGKLGRELMCDEHRRKIHRSLQKAAELLDEIQSIRLAQLRVQLHFEVARCEVAADLLTKGQAELTRAKFLDYTLADSELTDERITKYLGEDATRDPAPFLRDLEPSMDEQAWNLGWKTNLHEEASDIIDQEILTFDQIQKQPLGKASVASSMMMQSYGKLKDALEELTPERLAKLPDKFEAPPRLVNSAERMELLKHRAPATISRNGPRAAEITLAGQAAPQQIQDQRPKSEHEEAVVRVKRIVQLMCKIGVEAYRRSLIDLAIDVCDRAILTSRAGVGLHESLEAKPDVAFGPAPTEVEGALLIAEAAYTKALCLSKQLEEFGVSNGMDDEQDEEVQEAPAEEDGGEEVEPLTAEEKALCVDKKRQMIRALLYGMEVSREFRQWWNVANGLVHWWNLHLELVELSSEEPKLLNRVLPEYREGLKELQQYLYGPDDWKLPDGDLEHWLAARLVLAHIDASVIHEQLGVLDADQMLVLKRLGPDERKLVMARVTELCKIKDKPLPDLTKLTLERLSGGAGAPAAPAPKKGAAPPPPVAPADKSDLAGNEAEVMLSMISAPYEKDSATAMQRVEKAVELLGFWEPRHNDESMLTLWAEFWTRLGRQCLREPIDANLGRKYALMCGIKGLGGTDAAMPKYASQERLRWRGACHALCGEVFRLLVDPHKQEKESILKLRTMSIEQFQRCCEYAVETRNEKLAAFGAKSLWNVALPLLHSAQTRQLLIAPMLTATRALGAVKYQEDPFFFVGLYVALFDCYSDREQWDAVHEMLNEAFAAVPSSNQRRLWSLRMLALSKQGKNVVMAMSKMKESQAKAQAAVWLVLAHASAKRVDQLDAYGNAIRILDAAEQPEVVEVRLEFADWLVRNGFAFFDALEQLTSAAGMLLDVEEADEDEEEGEDDEDMGFSKAGSQASSAWGSRSDTRSERSRRSGASRRSVARSQRSRASVASKASRRSRASRASLRSSRRSRTSASVASKRNKQKKAEEDEAAIEQLYSHHYDQLLRIYAARSQLSSGADLHSVLLGAAHFVVRFFVCTVELANSCAQQMTSVDAGQSEDGLLQATGRARSSSVASMGVGAKKEDAPILLPSFATPVCLSDWAFEERWPWCGDQGAVLAEVLAKAQQADVLPVDSISWVGHADAMPKPPQTFHTLARLQRDLAEQGLHLWTFPVFALLQQLALIFDEGPLRTSICCFAYMRLSRYATESRLLDAATAATAKWREVLPKIAETFASFEDQLEQVRDQRAGRNSSDELDSDWLNVTMEDGSNVPAPWARTELLVYEVWAELADECRRHGELYQACKITNEAITHARVHGDRRTLRSLYILKARLFYDEGKYADAARTVKQVTAADLAQTAEVALVLSDIYLATGQLVLAGEVLKDANRAIQASPEVSAKTVEPPPGSTMIVKTEQSAGIILRECVVLNAEVQVEIQRLGMVNSPTRDWLRNLSATFELHEKAASKLRTGEQHYPLIESSVMFAKAAVRLLEAQRTNLVHDAELDADHGGALSLGILASYASRLCDSLAACRATRDALLLLAVPAEGVETGSISPAQCLCASLDVWHARSLWLRRSLRAAEKLHRSSDVARREASGGHFGRRAVENGTHLDKPLSGDEKAQNWQRMVDDKIDEEDRMKNAARELSEVEDSLALVSSAVGVLKFLTERPEGSGDPAAPETPCALTDALVELGRLHLELGAASWAYGKLQFALPGAPSKWHRTGDDWRERVGMQFAERCSNTLQGRDPGEIAKVAPPAESAESKAPPSDAPPLPHETIGISTLCDAVKIAVGARQFATARRALQALALEAYGAGCPDATFEFLVWLQSVDVCLRAEEAFSALLPHEHKEAVQLRLVDRLEKSWYVPQTLESYRTSVNRLQRESPSFQRLQLSSLPSVNDLLLTYLPPLTLVVTLQIHDGHLYVGASCSPPEGDAARRLEQLRPFVARLDVQESELHACVKKLREIDVAIEKEFINVPGVNQELQCDYAEVMLEAEAHLVRPICEQLEVHFWAYGLGIEHPLNPKQLVLLPDNALWRLPLEKFASVLRLVGANNHSGLSRDLSLHLAAQRVSRVVEDPATGDRKQLQARVPTARPESTALLTDTFNEDELYAGEDPKSEVLNAVHKRLVEAKVIGNATTSLHGGQFTVSPADIKTTLADSTAFYSLGFGNFSNLLNLSTLASLDLRHLAILGLFQRAMNFRAFRRQTKMESSKTPRQVELESPYNVSLIAGFRGVQCTVLAMAPAPVAVSARSLEIFARGLQAGKTAGKALEDVLNVTFPQADLAELRYARTVEGGTLPGGQPIALNIAPPDPKAKAPPPQAVPASADVASWLPLHSQMVYCIVGVPWIVAEPEAASGKKK